MKLKARLSGVAKYKSPGWRSGLFSPNTGMTKLGGGFTRKSQGGKGRVKEQLRRRRWGFRAQEQRSAPSGKGGEEGSLQCWKETQGAAGKKCAIPSRWVHRKHQHGLSSEFLELLDYCLQLWFPWTRSYLVDLNRNASLKTIAREPNKLTKIVCLTVMLYNASHGGIAGARCFLNTLTVTTCYGAADAPLFTTVWLNSPKKNSIDQAMFNNSRQHAFGMSIIAQYNYEGQGFIVPIFYSVCSFCDSSIYNMALSCQ